MDATKFEKAAELGAAGVLIIHNAKGAAYGWDVVRNSWSKESFFLPDKSPTLLFPGLAPRTPRPRLS